MLASTLTVPSSVASHNCCCSASAVQFRREVSCCIQKIEINKFLKQTRLPFYSGTKLCDKIITIFLGLRKKEKTIPHNELRSSFPFIFKLCNDPHVNTTV